MSNTPFRVRDESGKFMEYNEDVEYFISSIGKLTRVEYSDDSDNYIVNQIDISKTHSKCEFVNETDKFGNHIFEGDTLTHKGYEYGVATMRGVLMLNDRIEAWGHADTNKIEIIPSLQPKQENN